VPVLDVPAPTWSMRPPVLDFVEGLAAGDQMGM
jgi:hypothetical protein